MWPEEAFSGPYIGLQCPDYGELRQGIGANGEVASLIVVARQPSRAHRNLSLTPHAASRLDSDGDDVDKRHPWHARIGLQQHVASL